MDKPWFKYYENKVPHYIDLPVRSINEIISEAINYNPNGIAVSYFGKEISYDELGKLISHFAIVLNRLGVRKGDRVAIMLPNIPQYVVFHFAVLKLGAILVPTNPLYVEREIKYQLNNSGAETIITLDVLYQKIANVVSETSLKNIIITTLSEYLPFILKLIYPIKAKKDGTAVKVKRKPGVHFYNELLTERFQDALPDVEVKPGDIAVLLYTGGTTGVSKGAVLTHKNLVSNMLQIKTWYTNVEVDKEVILSVLPFFHSFGLTTCLHFAVLLRSKMVLIPNPRDVKRILKSIEKEKATIFSGVPTLYVAINNYPQIQKFNISSLKGCVSGGAALPVEVSRQFEKITGGNLVEGYGLSETSPVTHANPFNDHRREGSIGIPVPNTDAMVVDPDTKEPVNIGEVGELAVKGPQVMQGYWQMPEENKQVLRDGWLFTGDIAKQDEDGYFYIVDRKKDMIIAGGFNIYPREIEEVLFEHPDILEAAVVGVEDEYRGETVKAFIVPKPGKNLATKEIINWCKKGLAPFKVPRQIEFRTSLPKSNIGKVLRRELK